MSAASANLPALPSSLSPEGNLSRYLSEIRKFPLLEPQQEFMLAKAWREHGDTKAAHQLVTSHLRLVAKIAMGYRGYGLPVAELISEGNVGMMQAVKRFDPDRGFRLATYAMWWIRASIQEYILHSWSLVKMGTTAAQKKLFFNLRKLKGQMQAIEEGDLSPEQVTKIATRLGVPEEEVVNMNRRLAAPDSSLNAAVKAEGDMEWQDWLVDDTPNQEARLGESQELGQRKHMLAQALKGLSDRERHIIVERRLVDEPKTLEDLSAKYGISRERVRQIEVRAFDKLQKAMKNMVVDAATENSRKVDAHAARRTDRGCESDADDQHPERQADQAADPQRHREAVEVLEPGHGRLRARLRCVAAAPAFKDAGGDVPILPLTGALTAPTGRRQVSAVDLPAPDVDLGGLAVRPLGRFLGRHALDRLRVHVDDDVLAHHLGRLAVGRPGIADQPALGRQVVERLQHRIDLPHLVRSPTSWWRRSCSPAAR